MSVWVYICGNLQVEKKMDMLSLVTINETQECREAAEVYLLENHTKGLRSKESRYLP
jgi:hypothetical protein